MGHAVRPKFVGDPDWVDPLLKQGPVKQGPQPGVMEHCHVCGLVDGGCFGFGASRTKRGVWACTDPDCRAEAEARAHGTTSTLIAAE